MTILITIMLVSIQYDHKYNCKVGLGRRKEIVCFVKVECVLLQRLPSKSFNILPGFCPLWTVIVIELTKVVTKDKQQDGPVEWE